MASKKHQPLGVRCPSAKRDKEYTHGLARVILPLRVLTVRYPTSYTYLDQRNGRCYLIYYIHRELPIWSLVSPLTWKPTPEFSKELHALVSDARKNDPRLAPLWPVNMCEIPETYVHEGNVKACVYQGDTEELDGTPKETIEGLFANVEYRVKVYIGQKLGNWVGGKNLCARGNVKAKNNKVAC